MRIQRSCRWMIVIAIQAVWLVVVVHKTHRTTSSRLEQLSSDQVHNSHTDYGLMTVGIPARFEIVTTILHDSQQSKRSAASEIADWPLSPEIQDIPITICSPDRLRRRSNITYTQATVFRPEDAFSHILNSNRTGKVTILPMVNGLRSGEAPGYLSFILNNWDSLPDVTIFLHGNPMAHNPNIVSDIRRIIAGDGQNGKTGWTPQQIGFLQLNLGPMLCRAAMGPAGSPDDWPLQWELLGFDPKHFPGRVKLPCCAQFMVTKERIRLRPKWFYQQALKIVYEFNDGTFLEHFWHVVWGEHAILSEDRELRTYIMSNWTKPVHDAIVHKPYINHAPLHLTESMKPWYDKYIAEPDSYYPIVRNRKDSCPPGDYCYFYVC